MSLTLHYRLFVRIIYLYKGEQPNGNSENKPIYC